MAVPSTVACPPESTCTQGIHPPPHERRRDEEQAAIPRPDGMRSLTAAHLFLPKSLQPAFLRLQSGVEGGRASDSQLGGCAAQEQLPVCEHRSRKAWRCVLLPRDRVDGAHLTYGKHGARVGGGGTHQGSSQARMPKGLGMSLHRHTYTKPLCASLRI